LALGGAIDDSPSLGRHDRERNYIASVFSLLARLRPMITPWVVRLEVARDDDGSLSDDQMAELSEALAGDQMQPLLTRGDSGTVRVQVTVQATNDQAARSVAERMLRDRAYQVWAAHGLPPFTITFIEASPGEQFGERGLI
jgi:hypothetical protein